jgi:Domain of unknown function (DUF4280)
MGLQVCLNAVLTCPFGAAPSTLTVIPAGRPLTTSQAAANIMDFAPMLNIKPFGVCSSLAFPPTAAATAAALGVLTPMPCIPGTVAPWVPGSPTVLINNFPALNNSSQCMCMWGGVITISFPGQTTTMTA